MVFISITHLYFRAFPLFYERDVRNTTTTPSDAGAVQEGSVSGRCAVGTIPGGAKHLTQPSGAGSARAGRGKEKGYQPEEPAGFLRGLLRKREYLIAKSVGISDFSPREFCKSHSGRNMPPVTKR